MQYFLYNYGVKIDVSALLSNLEKDVIHNPELISYEYPIDLITKKQLKEILTNSYGSVSLEIIDSKFVKFNNVKNNFSSSKDCTQLMKFSAFLTKENDIFILNCAVVLDSMNDQDDDVILKQYVLTDDINHLLLDIHYLANKFLINCNKLING